MNIDTLGGWAASQQMPRAAAEFNTDVARSFTIVMNVVRA
jgi:hypothetical protein